MANQNDMDRISDKIQRGEISALEANVLMIQCEGVRIIKGRIPADVRKVLNKAVKEGRLGHLRKGGRLPEAYFHKNALWDAKEKRAAYARRQIEAVLKVVAPPSIDA